MFAISDLRFGLLVQIPPIAEPEPTKRFGFDPLPKPKSRTPGSDSGLNQVQEVHELDHGQSNCSRVQ